MSVSILIGDALTELRKMPAESVDMICSSPPYWGLRCYGVDGQLGQERTLGEHLAAMLEVFRECRRILKPTGTCWINYGDCYATSPNGRSAADTKAAGGDDRTFRDKPISTVGPIYEVQPDTRQAARRGRSGNLGNGGINGISVPDGRVVAGGYLKPKDLCMVPQRLFIALQEDGWWVRSVLPWVKRNGMPESISDRPANSIEYVGFMVKSGRTTCWRHESGLWVYERPAPDYVWRNSETDEESTAERRGSGWRRVNRWSGFDYFYDAETVRRKASPNTNARVAQDLSFQSGSARAHGGARPNGAMKAVVRSPKTAPSGSGIRANESFEAATSGIVLHDRNFRNTDLFFDSLAEPYGLVSDASGIPLALDVTPQAFKEAHFATFPPRLVEPLIRAGCPVGGTVLDPFFGAGTTGLVAERLGRHTIGIELNPEYAEIARSRIRGDLGRVVCALPETARPGAPLLDAMVA